MQTLSKLTPSWKGKQTMDAVFANAIVKFDCEEITEVQFSLVCAEYVEMAKVLLGLSDHSNVAYEIRASDIPRYGALGNQE